MKTRIIQTRFWDDDAVQSVSADARFLWIFLLTNKEIGMTRYVRIPDAFLKHYLSFTDTQLSKAKQEIENTGKVFFSESWVCIKNLERENKYKNSPKLEQPYEDELSHVPSEVIALFKGKDSSIGSTIGSSTNSTTDSLINSKTINHKSKTKNQKGVYSYEKFLKDFNETVGSEHRGDTKTRGMLRARLADGFSEKDIQTAIQNAKADDYLMGDNESGKRYLTPEYILRSNKLDEWLSVSTAPVERTRDEGVIVKTRKVK